MFDTIFGLPVHPLVVHAVVVLVPMAAAGAVVIALVPRWRATFAWIVVALTAAGTVSAFVAKQAGEALEDRVEDTLIDTTLLDTHTDAGETVPLFVLGMLVVLVAFVLYSRARDRAAQRDGASGPASRDLIGTVLAGVLVLASILATFGVIRAGHTGSESVWKGLVLEQELEDRSGSGGGDED